MTKEELQNLAAELIDLHGITTLSRLQRMLNELRSTGAEYGIGDHFNREGYELVSDLRDEVLKRQVASGAYCPDQMEDANELKVTSNE